MGWIREWIGGRGLMMMRSSSRSRSRSRREGRLEGRDCFELIVFMGRDLI